MARRGHDTLNMQERLHQDRQDYDFNAVSSPRISQATTKPCASRPKPRYCKKRKARTSPKESVEEFLARGGQIDVITLEDI